MMENNDTICLLKECDSGTKMAVASIDEVMDKVQSSDLKDLLAETKGHHEELGNDIHSMLLEHGSRDKDPNPMAKSMSWMKTNMKMVMDESDATVAGLITDGCDMGIKSLCKYMNQYNNADKPSKDVCERLISIEDTLRKDLRTYL